MTPGFVIDALPESAGRYRDTHVIVAVDIFRATTTIITALACGRRVYPVASVVEALRIAGTVPDALLAGEQNGITPPGFDLNNSPTVVDRLADRRPLVLLTSAGTQLLAEARGARATYVACFRNLSVTVQQLAWRHRRVALIGAGTRGQPRLEDQMACAWMGARLLAEGFRPETPETAEEVERLGQAELQAVITSPSTAYLRETGQGDDIQFVLTHVNDVAGVAVYDGKEVVLRPLRTGELYESALAAQA